LKKIYISGPISNMQNLNREAFEQEAERIRAMGDAPVNPHDISEGIEETTMTEQEKWRAYMVNDIRALLTCDAIHLLPGWENSRGAVIEEIVAEAMNIERVVV
jgi:hypothetical protein